MAAVLFFGCPVAYFSEVENMQRTTAKFYDNCVSQNNCNNDYSNSRPFSREAKKTKQTDIMC